jgi:hypothetical protein
MHTRQLLVGLVLASSASAVYALPSAARLLDAERSTVLELVAAAAAGDGEIVLHGLPLADHTTLRLRRLELLAPGFRLRVDGELRPAVEVASRFVVLAGSVAEMPSSVAVLVLDRRELTASGSVSAGGERWQVGISAPDDSPTIAALWSAERSADEPLDTFADDSLFLAGGQATAKARPPNVVRAPGGEYAASLVIDSDYEFVRSQGSEEQALRFVLGVMAAVSELYRHQVGVSFELQEVSLHATPDDPWEAPETYQCEGGSPVLWEFGLWYIKHRPVARFPRTAALMFTGKAGGDCGGQAVIGSLCSVVMGDQAYGMVVVPSGVTAAARQDTTAHELGHIFGSVHTHCYAPPVDVCSALEADRGCHDGAVETPADGGSLMSYCSTRAFSLGEADRYGLGSERVPQTIRAFVDGRAGACLRRTSDPFALQAAALGRTVSLAWLDPFSNEKGWEVEQRQANGRFTRVRTLAANATGVDLTVKKPGTAALRVRAKVGRTASEYSAVVEVVVP